MRSLAARAPVRIDFGGGWTDVPPICDDEGGCVCNLAIAHYATVRVRRASNGRAVGPPTVHADTALAQAALRRSGLADEVVLDVRSDFPMGAGLGGSSACGVAVTGALAAWRGDPLDRSAIAEASRTVEIEDLGVAGGRQDHYASAYGGALALTFGEGTDVRRLPVSSELRAELERRCIVGYTGQARVSGDMITAVLDAYRARVPRVLTALGRMKTLAESMIEALERGSVDDLGELVGEHWEHQRSLHRGIPTPLIDEILARARMAGALGGKALGASGGGCVLVIAGPDDADRVRAEVGSMSQLIPVTMDEGGFTWMAEE